MQSQNTTLESNIETELNKLRHNIDILDSKLITLLHQRFEYVKEIGHLKNQNQASIYRPDREKEIIEKLLQHVKKENLNLLDKQILEAIFYEIFAISRNLESPQKIAFLGPIGSYTHQAAEERFGPLSSYLALTTISAVFQALENKNAKYGVIPIENNTNGMVGESIDNLVQYDFKIINEIILPIHHSFATKAQKLENIKKIYSKDIAFGQCSNFLLHYQLHEIEHIPVSSTAIGAKLASEDENSAAICSQIAAKLHKIPIMFENIQNHSHNKTRFVIITDSYSELGKHNKTSIFVTMKDFKKSGALFALLKDFKEEQINITKIDSRPVHNSNDFQTGFYMDFHGHKDDENVQRVFKKRKDEIKWLGSYPSCE